MDPLNNGAIILTYMVNRPRISEKEMVPVMKLIYHQLARELNEGFSEDSKHLFHVLWRFCYPSPGKPAYPELNKENLEGLLNMLIEDFQRA